MVSKKQVEHYVGGATNLQMIASLVIAMGVFQVLRSLVRDVVMPIFTLGSPYGGWEVSTISVGPISIGWGVLLADILTLAGIVWLVVYLLYPPSTHSQQEVFGEST